MRISVYPYLRIHCFAAPATWHANPHIRTYGEMYSSAKRKVKTFFHDIGKSFGTRCGDGEAVQGLL